MERFNAEGVPFGLAKAGSSLLLHLLHLMRSVN